MKLNTVKLWIAVSVLLIVGYGSVNGQCPDSKRLKDGYNKKAYIALSFTQLIHSEIFESIDTLTGTVLIGPQGRFRLDMPSQQIVSNGVLYWSYSIDNQQVLVDSINGLANWNPLTVIYDPNDVYQCVAETKKDSLYVFDMQAVDSGMTPQSFSLTLKRGNLFPVRVDYHDDNDSRIEIFINDFRQPNSLPDSLFEFVVPKGVELIDMP